MKQPETQSTTGTTAKFGIFQWGELKRTGTMDECERIAKRWTEQCGNQDLEVLPMPECFCGGKGWVMLVGMGAANRRIPCPDCNAEHHDELRGQERKPMETTQDSDGAALAPSTVRKVDPAIESLIAELTCPRCAELMHPRHQCPAHPCCQEDDLRFANAEMSGKKL